MHPPAPSGMKGAHADGVFAFVGAPMPVEAARLAPCPAIANEDIARWPSRAYRLCGGGTTIHVVAASWLAPRAHIGVGHSKTPSGAQGRPAGDPAARASSRPGRIGRMGARSAGGIAPGRPSSLPPRLWRLLHKDGRQGPRGNDCASWENSDGSAESARAP